MLICDGDKNPDVQAGRRGTITVRFAGKGKSADDLIAELVEKSTTPKRLTVVSSDHAILKAARRRKCATLTSEEFLQHLVTDVQHRQILQRKKTVTRKPSSNTITAEQVGKWIALFDVDEAAVAAEAAKAMELDEPEPEAESEEESAAETARTESQSKSSSKSDRLRTLAPEQRETRHRTAPPEAAPAAPEAVLPSDLLAEAERILAEPLNDAMMMNQPHRQGRTKRRADNKNKGKHA